VGSVISIFGVWARLIIGVVPHFYVILIATVPIAIGQPFYLNVASKLATVWFSDSERAIATAIGSLALPIGCILGFAIGPILVSKADEIDREQGKRDFLTYLVV